MPVSPDRPIDPFIMLVGEQKSPGRPLRTRFLLFAVPLLLTSGAATVDASCGDYVTLGNADHGPPTAGQPNHGPAPGMPGPVCQRQMPLPTLPTKGVTRSPPLDPACWPHWVVSHLPPLAGGVFEPSPFVAGAPPSPPLRPPGLA